MDTDFSIEVIYDTDAGVYVGTSENIPGLTIEESTVHEFIQTTMDAVPYLLERNLKINECEHDDVNVHIHLKQLPSSNRQVQVNPIYSWHTDVDCAYPTA